MRIGYARVSTHEQNLELQVDALQEAGCEEIYTDQVSGAAENRPGLEKALDFLRPGDTLVVWRLDRLGRSLEDLIGKVDALEEEEKDFVSLEESIDTSSAGGRLVFQIFGALAEFERNLVRERTRAGLEAARARGREGGRPPAMDADDVRTAARLMANRHESAKKIADRFDISKATLYRYVSPEGSIRQLP